MDPLFWMILIIVFGAGVGLGWWLGRRPRAARASRTPKAPEPEPQAPVVLDRAFLEARAASRKQQTEETDTP